MKIAWRQVLAAKWYFGQDLTVAELRNTCCTGCGRQPSSLRDVWKIVRGPAGVCGACRDRTEGLMATAA